MDNHEEHCNIMCVQKCCVIKIWGVLITLKLYIYDIDNKFAIKLKLVFPLNFGQFLLTHFLWMVVGKHETMYRWPPFGTKKQMLSGSQKVGGLEAI